jgi:hypothetical protein
MNKSIISLCILATTYFSCLADDVLPVPIIIKLVDSNGYLIHKIDTLMLNRSGYNKTTHKEIEGESSKCQTYPVGLNVSSSAAGAPEYRSNNQSSCDVFGISTNPISHDFRLKRIIYQTKAQPQGIISINQQPINLNFTFDKEWKYKIQETGETIQILLR